MQNVDTLIVDLKDPEAFRQQLDEAFQHTSLKSLTIQLKANHGWVVFAKFPGRPDIENAPSYELKYVLGSLPESLGALKRLELLKVSFLGLESLPESIVHLTALHELDISFNKLDFSKELQKLMKLKQLKLLKAYGCGVTEEEVKALKNVNPNLKVLFTGHHLSDEYIPAKDK